MRHKQQLATQHFDLSLRAILTLLCVAIFASGICTQAQTFTVLHSFSNSDGAHPYAGLTLDSAGNLYGTTQYGGVLSGNCPGGCGTVFKLSRHGAVWAFSDLYKFSDAANSYPQGRVAFGSDGLLYGTASGYGGLGHNGYGAVFTLRPPATICKAVPCYWRESLIFQFDGVNGQFPLGDLTFDGDGNLYGATQYGGTYGFGTVYQLVRSTGWSENLLHDFTNGPDGGYPKSGVAGDHAGNLYGTASQDSEPSTYGLVYELSPSGSAWTNNILHYFQGGNDGGQPYAGLTFDPAGNLYGATLGIGSGVVFQLTPTGGNWNFNPLLTLPGRGSGPYGTLVMDAAGNLYGATESGGVNGQGSVFKLTPSAGGWTYTDLHDFNGSDGSSPIGSLVVGADGNIYGTTYGGANSGCEGDSGCGEVFEVAP